MDKMHLYAQFHVTQINNFISIANFTRVINYAMWHMQRGYFHIKRALILQEPSKEWENCKGRFL